MSRYFEVIYPERMKELKEDLDMISTKHWKIPLNDIESQSKSIKEFHKVFIKFIQNTKLHLTHDSVRHQLASEDEIKYITPEYFLEYFGKDTPTGKMFSSIKKHIWKE